MSRRGCLFLAVSCLIGIGVPCLGQEANRTTAQLHFDLRFNQPSEGSSRGTLYSGALLVNSRLAPGLQFVYNGEENNAPLLNGKGGRFRKFVTQKALLRKEWRDQQVQVGVMRLPFGLYNTEETYASGLIDYPLARVDAGLNAVDWGVPGVGWSGGSPTVQFEAVGFGGQSAGVWSNVNNASGGAARVQTYFDGVILGVSRWDGTLSTSFRPGEAGAQPTHMTGLDLRWTRPHLLVRGEYLFGTLANAQMHGWYVDAYYHLPKYQRWTLASRLEEFQANTRVRSVWQYTVGVRYIQDRDWTLALNWRLNSGVPYRGTWTPDTAGAGDIYLQAYRKIKL